MLATPSNEEFLSKRRPLSSFIRKLWFILTDEEYQEFIFWVDNGQVICIPNYVRFSQAILPKFFKHNNWQSFVRQLNLYGFRKVYQLNLSYDDSIEKRTVWHFKHYSFQRNKPEKLFDIKRRANKGDHESTQDEYKDDGSPVSPPAVEQQNKLEKELADVKQKLSEVDEKRQDLLQQIIQLNKIQSNQREAIKTLSNTFVSILNNNPNIRVKDKTFAEIVEKLVQVQEKDILSQEEEISELEEDELEDDDDDYMDVENLKNPFYPTHKVNYDNYIPAHSLPNTSSSDVIRQTSFQAQDHVVQYHPSTTASLPRTLPPIRTLFHSRSSEVLPPIKRPRAV